MTVNAIGTKQTQRKCGQKQTCTNTGFKHGNTDARNAKQRGMNAESKTANGNLIRHPKRGKIYSPKGKTHMQRNAKGRRNNALKIENVCERLMQEMQQFPNSYKTNAQRSCRNIRKKCRRAHTRTAPTPP